MGGSHQLRVMERLLYKCHFPRVYKELCVDAKTIAEGSIEKALEAHQYYQNVRKHKECLEAIV